MYLKSCDLSDTVTTVAGTLYELYVTKCCTAHSDSILSVRNNVTFLSAE